MLDAQSLVGLISLGVTVLGSAGAYIVSVEKRLNGRKVMQDSLNRIEQKMDDTNTEVQEIKITVARLDQKMEDRRG